MAFADFCGRYLCRFTYDGPYPGDTWCVQLFHVVWWTYNRLRVKRPTLTLYASLARDGWMSMTL